jgi:hypothetical protein
MPGPPRRRCQSSVGRYPDPAYLFAFARMNNDSPRQSLLEQLDVRQNELLAELEQLNTRIEQVLRDTLSWQAADRQLAEPA